MMAASWLFPLRISSANGPAFINVCCSDSAAAWAFLITPAGEIWVTGIVYTPSWNPCSLAVPACGPARRVLAARKAERTLGKQPPLSLVLLQMLVVLVTLAGTGHTAL